MVWAHAHKITLIFRLPTMPFLPTSLLWNSEHGRQGNLGRQAWQVVRARRASGGGEEERALQSLMWSYTHGVRKSILHAAASIPSCAFLSCSCACPYHAFLPACFLPSCITPAPCCTTTWEKESDLMGLTHLPPATWASGNMSGTHTTHHACQKEKKKPQGWQKDTLQGGRRRKEGPTLRQGLRLPHLFLMSVSEHLPPVFLPFHSPLFIPRPSFIKAALHALLPNST